MLTKDDLKQLEKLLESVVERKTKEIIQEEVPYIIAKENLDLKRHTLRMIEDSASPIRREIKEIKNGIQSLEKRIHSMEKGQKVIISRFDTEYLELRGRVKRIESHLNLKAS